MNINLGYAVILPLHNVNLRGQTKVAYAQKKYAIKCPPSSISLDLFVNPMQCTSKKLSNFPLIIFVKAIDHLQQIVHYYSIVKAIGVLEDLKIFIAT